MDYFEGTIEHIIYYSPDTGYTVFKFAPENGELMTVIGSFPPLSPGEVLKIKGKWVINPRFGQQFKVENYLPVLPASIKGIQGHREISLFRLNQGYRACIGSKNY